jgi:hypothetical protein
LRQNPKNAGSSSQYGDERWVMVAAILVSIAFMLFFAKPIGVSSGFRAKGLNLRQNCDSGAVETLYNFE